MKMFHVEQFSFGEKMSIEHEHINPESGLRKKSFELYFNSGSIWCEHLDGMGELKEQVIEKFTYDKKIFCRPSMTSFLIINLDETVIDTDIISCIVETITGSQKRFMKIAFVGVKKVADKNDFRAISYIKGCPIEFFDDFEKAKQWVLP